MVSIFSTPKPFRNHEAVIQRNAIQSWTLLDPHCEVILFGDDAGAAEVAAVFQIRHEPAVLRNKSGAKYLRPIFQRAQEMSRHDLLCYVNCDIILMSDFAEALQRVYDWNSQAFMIGRRWDVDIRESWSFGEPDWEKRLRALAMGEGKQRPPSFIDFFVFPRNAFRNIPELVIGRVGWDNWLVWKARNMGLRVVDVSEVVVVAHQNHDYAYHPEGKKGVWEGEEATRNYELAGGWTHFYTIEDANYRLSPSAIKRNLTPAYFKRRLEIARRWAIDQTRPLRHRLGIRRKRPAV